MNSIHIEPKKVEKSMIERSDSCVVPAAGIVLESVLAMELAREILEEFGSNQMSNLVEAMNRHRQAMRDF